MALVSLLAFSTLFLQEAPHLTGDAQPAVDTQSKVPTILVEPQSALAEGVPQSAGTRTEVGAQEMLQREYRTLPQALKNVPQIMVQETAHGQGSPYVRGFTGYQNVLLVDGIRLNNSTFRSGPNQYWNTVDSTSLDRLEVELGPQSSVYGSDALGGVVRSYTRSPYGDMGDPTGKLIYRFSDAGNYHIMRAEGSFVGERTSILLGVTSKNFGDVEGGQEVGLQPDTGYDETDADLKVEHYLNDNARLVLGHYRVNQNDVPRTHRTVSGIGWEGLSIGSDLSRSLDQNRELTYLQLHQEDLGGYFDTMRTSISWQSHKEERVRVRSNGNLESQGFDVGTLGLFHNMEHRGASGHWTYGLDYYRDGVNSFLERGSNQTPADDIQGPLADDATYESAGLFVKNRKRMGQRTDLIAGARFSSLHADADSVRDPVTNTQTAFGERYQDLSLSVEFEHNLHSEPARRGTARPVWYGGISQGFRAPSLSDLSRFDSARTNEFEVPSTDLDKETVIGIQTGVRSESGRARYDIGAFYTRISDGIVRVPTGDTNAAGELEVTKDNLGDGYVWGLHGSVDYALTPALRGLIDASYQRGEQDTYPTSAPALEREPLDRLMPFSMHAGLRWQEPSKKGWVELRLTHAAKADRLSTRDQGDTSRIPPGGTPAYSLLDLRGGWQLNRHTEWTLGLENLFDEDYRVHGSGVNGPGRGLVVGLVLSF